MADLTRLELVDPAQFKGPAITTMLTRSDVQSALDYAEGADLLLDIGRSADGDFEAHTLVLAMERKDLEELLRADDGEEISMQFDAEALEGALDETDVEAHGMRERAAVLAAAATVAAGFAGHAAAQPTADVGGTPVAGQAMTAEQAWQGVPQSTRQAAERAIAQSNARATSQSSSGGIEISAPSDSQAAALAGGAVLLITGAGLAMHGRKRPARPA
jgi:hypothetical protein